MPLWRSRMSRLTSTMSRKGAHAHVQEPERDGDPGPGHLAGGRGRPRLRRFRRGTASGTFPARPSNPASNCGPTRTATAIGCSSCIGRSSASTFRSSAARTSRALSAGGRSGWSAHWDWSRCRSRPSHGGGNQTLLRVAARRRRPTPSVRQLLGDLAEEERKHAARGREAGAPRDRRRPGRCGQPGSGCSCCRWSSRGWPGLMDGSVSTLAPLFAAAFATRKQPGRRFWSAWPPAWAPASAWASPRRSPTTAASPAEVGRSCAASFAALMTALGGLGHYPSLSHPRLSHRHLAGRGRGHRGIGPHRLDSPSLHGHALAVRVRAGRRRRRARVSDGNLDWELVGQTQQARGNRLSPAGVLELACVPAYFGASFSRSWSFFSSASRSFFNRSFSCPEPWPRRPWSRRSFS